MTSTTKKIISNIAETVGEAVKDSVKQVVGTIDPTKMIEQAMGVKQSGPPAGGEFSRYLESLGGNLTDTELEKKKQQFENEKSKEMEAAQTVIRNALPEHLRPRLQNEPSVFEKQKQEELKKAQIVEAQKKQQKAISDPVGKTTGKKKQKGKTPDFEAAKNVKIG